MLDKYEKDHPDIDKAISNIVVQDKKSVIEYLHNNEINQNDKPKIDFAVKTNLSYPQTKYNSIMLNISQ